MVSPGWARLRPFNADLRRLVTVLFIIVSAAMVVGGAWAIVDFIRTNDSRDVLSFTVFVYVILFGVLLILGELGFPSAFYSYFGFLATSSGRSFFLLFAASLAISAGWRDELSVVSSVLLKVSGFCGIAFAFLGLCYGADHGATEGEGLTDTTTQYATDQGSNQRRRGDSKPAADHEISTGAESRHTPESVI